MTTVEMAATKAVKARSLGSAAIVVSAGLKVISCLTCKASRGCRLHRKIVAGRAGMPFTVYRLDKDLGLRDRVGGERHVKTRPALYLCPSWMSHQRSRVRARALAGSVCC